MAIGTCAKCGKRRPLCEHPAKQVPAVPRFCAWCHAHLANPILWDVQRAAAGDEENPAELRQLRKREKPMG